MAYNKNITRIFGLSEEDIESDDQEVSGMSDIIVHPEEVITDVTREDDIEEKLVASEKQLRELIDITTVMGKQLLHEIQDIEPRLRARNIEVANELLKTALDTLKTSISVQENKRKHRLTKQEKMSKEGQGGLMNGSTIENVNIITGSHADIIKQLEARRERDEDIVDIDSDEDVSK